MGDLYSLSVKRSAFRFSVDGLSVSAIEVDELRSTHEEA